MNGHDRDEPAPAFWRSRLGIGFLVLAAVAAWFLWEEHRAHLLGAAPYLLLLACPLMHLFMHRGHHGHRHSRGDAARDTHAGTGRPGDRP